MKLYEFPPARSIRDRWVLQELEVDFESVTVNLKEGEHHSPEFLKLNPCGRVPVLVDGGTVITESVAIALYLAEKYARFIPQDTKQRAQVHRWLLFTVTELEQPLWRINRHTLFYPEEQRSQAEIKLAREDFERVMPVLEQHLQGREYVAWEHATVADFILAYTLDWANECQLLEKFPVSKAYMERMYARPHAPLRIAKALASVS